MTWLCIRASVIGVSHLVTKIPCQDANDFRELDHGQAIAAVADGLGSAAQADVGARLAVQHCLDALSEALSSSLVTEPEALSQTMETHMRGAFLAARNALLARAEQTNTPLREFGTTLLAAYCSPDWLMVGHIGDGAVVARFEEEGLITVSPPDRGEYANEVTPLTMKDSLERVRYVWLEKRPTAIILFSDGLQRLMLDYAEEFTPFNGFFDPLLKGMDRVTNAAEASASLSAFLGSERVNHATDDDKTLVVMMRPSPVTATSDAEEASERTGNRLQNESVEPPAVDN